MKILVTGASGRLGKHLAPLFPGALTPSRKELDFTNAEQIEGYIKEHKLDILIHLAAMTAPPRCEQNKEMAWKVNVSGTERLVEACEEYQPKCYFVLMSTPCVFSGEDETPKKEDDVPNPDNYYGLTKLVQEIIVRRSSLKNLIIRANFAPYEKWPYPKAFTDRKSNYLFSQQLAKGIKDVVEANVEGVVHIVGNKVVSMHEFARMCPDSQDVGEMTYDEYYEANPNAVKLTKNMILASTRWKSYSIGEDLPK